MVEREREGEREREREREREKERERQREREREREGERERGREREREIYSSPLSLCVVAVCGDDKPGSVCDMLRSFCLSPRCSPCCRPKTPCPTSSSGTAAATVVWMLQSCSCSWGPSRWKVRPLPSPCGAWRCVPHVTLGHAGRGSVSQMLDIYHEWHMAMCPTRYPKALWDMAMCPTRYPKALWGVAMCPTCYPGPFGAWRCAFAKQKCPRLSNVTQFDLCICQTEVSSFVGAVGSPPPFFPLLIMVMMAMTIICLSLSNQKCLCQKPFAHGTDSPTELSAIVKSFTVFIFLLQRAQVWQLGACCVTNILTGCKRVNSRSYDIRVKKSAYNSQTCCICPEM